MEKKEGNALPVEEGNIAISVTLNQEVNKMLFDLMEYYREDNRSTVVRRAISHLYREEEKKRGKTNETL